MRGNILIIDDDKQLLESLELLLKYEFTGVSTISNPNLLLESLGKNSYDIVLLDMNFKAGNHSGNEGLYWLKEIQRVSPEVMVILITAYGDMELVIKATTQD